MGPIMVNIKVNNANRNLEITTTLGFIVPEKRDQEYIPQDSKGRAMDIIGAFSPRLIQALQKRQRSCLKMLLQHEDEIIFNDGFHIEWKRNNGSIGYFNVASFEVMNNAIGDLKKGNYSKYIENKAEVDQTLKALLNCPAEQQDHSDEGEFTFANLVSVLCECHFIA